MQKKFHLWLLIAAIWLGAPIGVVAQERKSPAFEHVHSLAMDSGGRTLFLGAHTGLFRSDDGGRSWKRVPVSAKQSHLDVMAVTFDPREPKTIYLGTHEAGVFKSTDSGAIWKQANNGLVGMDVHGLAARYL